MGNKLGRCIEYWDGLPNQLKQQDKLAVIDKLGKDLIQYLMENKDKIYCVELIERSEIKKSPYEGTDSEIYTAYLNITEVKVDPYPIRSLMYEDMELKQLSKSAIEEVKLRIRMWLKRIHL